MYIHLKKLLALYITALVLLFSGSSFSEDSTPIDVVLVIDSSGSMKKTDPLSLRIPAAKLFISLLDDNDRAGVVHFSDKGYPVIHLTPVDNDENREQLLSSADRISSNGLFTNLDDALRTGLSVLKNSTEKGRLRFLILMSDGMMDVGDPGQDKALTNKIEQELAPLLEREGVKVYSIAFTEQSDRKLLKKISKRTGGFYNLALTDKEFHMIFTSIFENLKGPDMLPINENGFLIDRSVDEITIVATKDSPDTQILLASPDGDSYTHKDKSTGIEWFASDSFDMITVTKPAEGRWEILFSSGEKNKAYVITDLKLNTNFDQLYSTFGDPLDIKIWLEKGNTPVTEQSLLSNIEVLLELTGPDGSTTELKPFNKGNGVYNRRIAPFTPGNHRLKVLLRGKTFEREKTYVFNVADVEESKVDILAELEKKKSLEEKDENIKDREHQSGSTSWVKITVQFISINILIAIIGFCYFKRKQIRNFKGLNNIFSKKGNPSSEEEISDEGPALESDQDRKEQSRTTEEKERQDIIPLEDLDGQNDIDGDRKEIPLEEEAEPDDTREEKDKGEKAQSGEETEQKPETPPRRKGSDTRQDSDESIKNVQGEGNDTSTENVQTMKDIDVPLDTADEIQERTENTDREKDTEEIDAESEQLSQTSEIQINISDKEQEEQRRDSQEKIQSTHDETQGTDDDRQILNPDDIDQLFAPGEDIQDVHENGESEKMLAGNKKNPADAEKNDEKVLSSEDIDKMFTAEVNIQEMNENPEAANEMKEIMPEDRAVPIDTETTATQEDDHKRDIQDKAQGQDPANKKTGITESDSHQAATDTDNKTLNDEIQVNTKENESDHETYEALASKAQGMSNSESNTGEVESQKKGTDGSGDWKAIFDTLNDKATHIWDANAKFKESIGLLVPEAEESKKYGRLIKETLDLLIPDARKSEKHSHIFTEIEQRSKEADACIEILQKEDALLDEQSNSLKEDMGMLSNALEQSVVNNNYDELHTQKKSIELSINTLKRSLEKKISQFEKITNNFARLEKEYDAIYRTLGEEETDREKLESLPREKGAERQNAEGEKEGEKHGENIEAGERIISPEMIAENSRDMLNPEDIDRPLDNEPPHIIRTQKEIVSPQSKAGPSETTISGDEETGEISG